MIVNRGKKFLRPWRVTLKQGGVKPLGGKVQMDFVRAFFDGFRLARETRLLRFYFSLVMGVLLLAAMPLAFAPPVLVSQFRKAAGEGIGAVFAGAFSAAGMLVQYYLILGLLAVLAFIFANAFASSTAKQLLAAKSAKNKPLELDFEKSKTLALERLPHILLATTLVFAITSSAMLLLGLATALPFIGTAIKVVQPFAAIAIALLFFFTEYAIVLGGKTAFNAINQSISVFEKNPLATLGTMGLSAIASMTALGLGLAPLLLAALLAGTSILFSQSIWVFLLSFALFSLASAILIAAFCFAQLLAIGIEASAYKQLAGAREWSK